VPEESHVTTRKLVVEGIERTVTLEPAIRKAFLRIPEPSLRDVRSDANRIADSLQDVYGIKDATIDSDLLKRLPRILRRSNWKATAVVYDERKVVSVEAGNTSDEAYGISFDIGTSKVIGHISNLVNGELVATESMENPQIIHGEDIISRIAYASKSNSSLRQLQKLIINCLNTLTSQLCKKSGLRRTSIYEMTVVGNTAMHHIFLGISPKHLGLSPYVPVVSDSIVEKAMNLSLKANPACVVHVFPVVAGFVGGDAVADIISTGIHESSELSMVLDVGTNTEIIIGSKSGLMACSCASGPAFEGAHINCGVKSVTGAIERLTIDPRRHDVLYQTIGNAAPVGICGSGIIDTVANLLSCGLVDKEGKLAEYSASTRISERDGEKVFVLASKKEGAKQDIVVTQKDIREVQLAKAAIYTGCHILMKRREAEPKDIRNFFLAGAFGNYIDPPNAKLIGMLPNVPTESISFVGNAAGAGARMALISKQLRRVADSVSREISYVELASESDFQSEFASAMYFPHKDLGRFQSVRDLL
jgi:uncharacterized 2Fe-2S/4Fe-4S cluster protein (DUF4445 family)